MLTMRSVASGPMPTKLKKLLLVSVVVIVDSVAVRVSAVVTLCDTMSGMSSRSTKSSGGSRGANRSAASGV